ncbi:C4-dicarboxylate ABC transporter substrate-binding protein [Marinobacter salinus]|uniref:TRAP transporter small permease protein n=1 Tax=Marinobacter salinus TaxID=1874317 RepID=A0A1D9GN93_9GAMM|nr:TRAP transporter small permease [Marinobacter salinus]AOY89097.1 C4-dicarboxylate ABC transporter substrate-binding protein [Marinobacter salinus]
MSAATVLEDDSVLSRADRYFFRLESVLNLAGGLAIFLLVLMATVNILGRWLFASPISGYVDWVEQAMAFIAFLGIAYTQRLGGHIRMDIFVSQLHGRWLWFSELLTTTLMLLLTLVLIYGSTLHFWRAYSIGDSSLDINLPTWPAKLVVPVALTILALRLMLQIWGYMRALRLGGDQPVAVPLVESPEEVAAREAEAVSGHDDPGAAR